MDQLFVVNTHRAFLNTDIIIKSQCDEEIVIHDNLCIEDYRLSPMSTIAIRLSTGCHVLIAKHGEQETHHEIYIEDAIKYGGGIIEKAFVFNDSNWVFVKTDDRLYLYNLNTEEEKVEYGIVPNEIISVGENDYVIFRTENDFSIYNAALGEIIINFNNYIYNNSHLVIYKDAQDITIYDFIKNKIVLQFNGNYSIYKNKLYFVKDLHLHCIYLTSNTIHKLKEFGEIKTPYYLAHNYLLIKDDCQEDQWKYTIYLIQKSPISASFILPHYISKFCGNNTNEDIEAKKELETFINSSQANTCKLNYTKIVNPGYDINEIIVEDYDIYGVISKTGMPNDLPSFKYKFLFNENNSFGDAELFADEIIIEQDTNILNDFFEEPSKGDLLGYSQNGKISVYQDNEFIYLYQGNKCKKILESVLDKANYSKAFFSSDGKSLIFFLTSGKVKSLDFDNMIEDEFEIDASSVNFQGGINGYLPNIEYYCCPVKLFLVDKN